VAKAPGGPVHVLVNDREAEHVPGCNMAFRRECLEAIGGFDPQFRTAGDDVDVCWRIREQGMTIGFNPGAVVWHHRRGSVRAYFRQQRGYGRAEAMLERKWPEKYNAVGHVSWAGRLYGGFIDSLGWSRSRIYHGTWGTAPFQSVYQPAPGLFLSLPAMPEWYLVLLVLAMLSSLSLMWPPLLNLFLPALALGVAAPVARAIASAARASVREAPPTRAGRLRARALIASLCLLQPLARLVGRLEQGLVPWRRRGGFALPYWRDLSVWTERWQAPDHKLRAVERSLRSRGYAVFRGGDYERGDLEVRGGAIGAARLRMATEEHGDGKQLHRLRIWPRCSRIAIGLTAMFVTLAGAATRGRWSVAAALFAMALLVALRAFQECGSAVAAFNEGGLALMDPANDMPTAA
jgi:hypothetical protein